MRVAIIDANYTDARFEGLAASWLRWEVERSTAELIDSETADVILVTLSSQQGMAHLRRRLERRNRAARIVMGGGIGYAPAVIGDRADAVCVGEGARFIRTLLTDGYEAALALPETWIPGMSKPVIPSTAFPWDLPPLRHPDGTVRLFGSRGCKYRCLFCQTGWEAPYRVNPDIAMVKTRAEHLCQCGERVAIVTNDGAESSVGIGGQQEFLSVRFSNLKRLMPLSRAMAKTVRIGIEGVSERLRRAVGKPVKNDELLSVTCRLLEQQKSVGVRWFFIPGLPGETEDDWVGLRDLIFGLKRLTKGVVLMNFHSFIPQPATPLGVLPLRDEYWERFEEFRRWFFHGPGFTRRVQIVAPNRYVSRLRRARQSMAATELELRSGWFDIDNPNWRVRYPASPDELRRVARHYAARVGMAPKLLL